MPLFPHPTTRFVEANIQDATAFIRRVVSELERQLDLKMSITPSDIPKIMKTWKKVFGDALDTLVYYFGKKVKEDRMRIDHSYKCVKKRPPNKSFPCMFKPDATPVANNDQICNNPLGLMQCMRKLLQKALPKIRKSAQDGNDSPMSIAIELHNLIYGLRKDVSDFYKGKLNPRDQQQAGVDNFKNIKNWPRDQLKQIRELYARYPLLTHQTPQSDDEHLNLWLELNGYKPDNVPDSNEYNISRLSHQRREFNMDERKIGQQLMDGVDPIFIVSNLRLFSKVNRRAQWYRLMQVLIANGHVKPIGTPTSEWLDVNRVEVLTELVANEFFGDSYLREIQKYVPFVLSASTDADEDDDDDADDNDDPEDVMTMKNFKDKYKIKYNTFIIEYIIESDYKCKYGDIEVNDEVEFFCYAMGTMLVFHLLLIGTGDYDLSMEYHQQLCEVILGIDSTWTCVDDHEEVPIPVQVDATTRKELESHPVEVHGVDLGNHKVSDMIVGKIPLAAIINLLRTQQMVNRKRQWERAMLDARFDGLLTPSSSTLRDFMTKERAISLIDIIAVEFFGESFMRLLVDRLQWNLYGDMSTPDGEFVTYKSQTKEFSYDLGSIDAIWEKHKAADSLRFCGDQIRSRSELFCHCIAFGLVESLRHLLFALGGVTFKQEELILVVERIVGFDGPELIDLLFLETEERPAKRPRIEIEVEAGSDAVAVLRENTPVEVSMEVETDAVAVAVLRENTPVVVGVEVWWEIMKKKNIHSVKVGSLIDLGVPYFIIVHFLYNHKPRNINIEALLIGEWNHVIGLAFYPSLQPNRLKLDDGYLLVDAVTFDKAKATVKYVAHIFFGDSFLGILQNKLKWKLSEEQLDKRESKFTDFHPESGKFRYNLWRMDELWHRCKTFNNSTLNIGKLPHFLDSRMKLFCLLIGCGLVECLLFLLCDGNEYEIQRNYNRICTQILGFNLHQIDFVAPEMMHELGLKEEHLASLEPNVELHRGVMNTWIEYVIRPLITMPGFEHISRAFSTPSCSDFTHRLRNHLDQENGNPFQADVLYLPLAFKNHFSLLIILKRHNIVLYADSVEENGYENIPRALIAAIQTVLMDEHTNTTVININSPQQPDEDEDGAQDAGIFILMILQYLVINGHMLRISGKRHSKEEALLFAKDLNLQRTPLVERVGRAEMKGRRWLLHDCFLRMMGPQMAGIGNGVRIVKNQCIKLLKYGKAFQITSAEPGCFHES